MLKFESNSNTIVQNYPEKSSRPDNIENAGISCSIVANLPRLLMGLHLLVLVVLIYGYES